MKHLPVVAFVCLVGSLTFAAPPGEGPALGPATLRTTQQMIAEGELTLDEIRLAGLKIFTTRFNQHDGYGDGPLNHADTISPGGRPSLQNNGKLLRINGLDAQGCNECHGTVSAATNPPTLGIGGVGGSVTNALIMPTEIDITDLDLDGDAGFTGRFANPPFLFGAGGIELLGREMTAELHSLREQAIASPGVPVALIAKGVSFGTIVADLAGEVDTSGVEGIDEDLIVRPFGRKGEFATLRAFDIEAMNFHFGMQPVDSAGPGVDADGDGIVDEILVGELSALSIFLATLDRPFVQNTPAVIPGYARFQAVGCDRCHVAALETEGTMLPIQFPDDPTDSSANVAYEVDLGEGVVAFPEGAGGGLLIPLFADLKRHDMGPALAETFQRADEQRNREFTTARLWGVADTAPYMHDGRAMTLTEAILMHGGEATAERDAFEALDEQGRLELLGFLRALRTPRDPAADLLNPAPRPRSHPNAQDPSSQQFENADPIAIGLRR